MEESKGKAEMEGDRAVTPLESVVKDSMRLCRLLGGGSLFLSVPLAYISPCMHVFLRTSRYLATPQRIALASAKRPLLLMLCGLDRLQDPSVVESMKWLPREVR